MHTSLFEVFKIGIGPSSSHTVGPMRAALDFLTITTPTEVHVHLYGSLALTGKGHGTDKAVRLGLAGQQPETVNENAECPFPVEIHFHKEESMPDHPNGLRFTAGDVTQGYYSIGGGAIVKEGQTPPKQAVEVPFPYNSADELLALGDQHNLPLWEIAHRNELAFHTEKEIDTWLKDIWQAMQECVRQGLQAQGILPGGLQVPRRAKALAERLTDSTDPLVALDWVDAWAMAVNEENASGHKVVTAPTNGAAGIIPAVAHYYERFLKGDGLRRYFLTAAMIGVLYKENASISGADVGCQGEVGVASSMAAGGLVAALNGSNRRIEKAAEIAMEHNLGMTCDPVGGLVQIPCIERNAMGAVKAINASRMALREGESHLVSLDRVIATMLQTGKDMRSIYKETSLGGLAVNVPLC